MTTQPFAPLAAIRSGRCASRRRGSIPPIRCCATRRRAATSIEAARAEYPVADADEVILLNERGEVCEGTITNLFLDTGEGGPLLTPRACCGLLPGVLREELLDAGKAREAVLTPADLSGSKAAFRRQFAARADPAARFLDGG